MPRWMLVSVEDDISVSSVGWVDADSPSDAIKEWVGEHHDRPILVCPAEHVRHFKPDDCTHWVELVRDRGAPGD